MLGHGLMCVIYSNIITICSVHRISLFTWVFHTPILTFFYGLLNLLIKKFLNAFLYQINHGFFRTQSISFIVSKTHFVHCFLFLPRILYLFHFFQIRLYENYSFFSIISKTKLFFSCFFLNLKAQYLHVNHPIQLQ